MAYVDDPDFTPDEILEELGASRAYHLAEAEKATAELRARVREARAAGVAKSEIARFSGVSRVTIDAWLT